MRGAVIVAPHFAIGQAAHQILERLPAIDTPDGLANARTFEPGLRQGGIVALAQHDV